MGHRSPPQGGSRGNRRTRGGAGRHNLGRGALRGPDAAIRVCLSCDRPFRSRGPWNRFCRRCREQQAEIEHESTRTYRVSEEVSSLFYREFDDF